MAELMEKLMDVEAGEQREEIKDADKEEMTTFSPEIERLMGSLEEKRKEIQDAESALQAQVEQKNKEMAELEAALNGTRWQEKLETVDKELAHFYREQRGKENLIGRAINKVFDEAAEDVERINLVSKKLKELKKKISGIESQLIQSDDDHDVKIKDAIEFKKAEIAREIEVAEEVKGAISVVREVNLSLGLGDESEEELFGRRIHRLPIYAQNIYDEVRRARGKPLKVRDAGLIRVAKIPEPRIIKARDELKKNLEVLTNKELVTCEEEGDTYIITENIREEVRS